MAEKRGRKIIGILLPETLNIVTYQQITQLRDTQLTNNYKSNV